VRADICTFVTLDTVVRVPCRNESGHTAFLELGGAGIPGTVLDTLESGNGEQVAVLCVDRTNHLVDELRFSIVVSESEVDAAIELLTKEYNGDLLVSDEKTKYYVRQLARIMKKNPLTLKGNTMLRSRFRISEPYRWNWMLIQHRYQSLILSNLQKRAFTTGLHFTGS